MADDLDPAIHELHDPLHDCQSQTGSLDIAAFNGLFLLEWFKNMRQEIAANADSVILNAKPIIIAVLARQQTNHLAHGGQAAHAAVKKTDRRCTLHWPLRISEITGHADVFSL